jgi:hypothetical protein
LTQFFFELFLRRQIGDDDADRIDLRLECGKRDQNRNLSSGLMHEQVVAAHGVGARFLEILSELLAELGHHELAKLLAANTRTVEPEYAGEVSIAVKDHRIRRNADGALIHLVDHQAVRVVRRRQRINGFALAAINHQSIYFAVPNRAERVFGFFQSPPEVFNFVSGYLFPCFRHTYSLMPNPIRSFCLFDKSPTNRRNGSGSLLINVGAAMICASRAASGLL